MSHDGGHSDHFSDPFSAHENHMPYDEVVALLNQCLRGTITPYCIEINALHILDWCRCNDLLTFHALNLIREMSNWGPLLKRRPVKQICLVRPELLFDDVGLEGIYTALDEHLWLTERTKLVHTGTSVYSEEVVDQLRLGPGVQSHFGSLAAINFSKITSYLNAINSTALPISFCGKL